MKKLRYESWLDFIGVMEECIEGIKQKDISFNIIYAIPRGGLVPATILSHAFNVDIGWMNGTGYRLIVDDIIATGSSLLEGVIALRKQGPLSVCAAITHGVLSGNAVEQIKNSKYLSKLLITDSIPLSEKKGNNKIKILSVKGLLAEAIKRIHREESVSCLFD